MNELTCLDYAILRLDENASINNIISSIMIQTNQGNTEVCSIVDKIEDRIAWKQLDIIYRSIARCYYKKIEYDRCFLELTKEICLRDLKLCFEHNYCLPDNDAIDILVVIANNYYEKEEALELINLVIESGFNYPHYIMVRDKIAKE